MRVLPVLQIVLEIVPTSKYMRTTRVSLDLSTYQVLFFNVYYKYLATSRIYNFGRIHGICTVLFTVYEVVVVADGWRCLL